MHCHDYYHESVPELLWMLPRPLQVQPHDSPIPSPSNSVPSQAEHSPPLGRSTVFLDCVLPSRGVAIGHANDPPSEQTDMLH